MSSVRHKKKKKKKDKVKKRQSENHSKSLDNIADASSAILAGARAPVKASVSSAQGGGSGSSWNFEVNYNDHFETPLRAYTDISPVLSQIAEKIGKTKAELAVYDPYFCQGSMVQHMSSLGFHNVINRNTDFYEDIAMKRIPEYDVMVTNPPYSGEHKQKLLTYLSNRFGIVVTYVLLSLFLL